MKITIITVCFNSSETVLDALRSIHSQDLQDLEHIIIDGGSTDGTIELIKDFGRYDLLISERDDGIYDAMNKGIALASGDIIGFLNSDDFYVSTDVLSNIAKEFMSAPSLDACYSDLIYVDPIDTSRTVRYWQSSNFQPNSFAKGWMPPHPTFFVHRSVYERYGLFKLDYRIAADVELVMRLLEVHKIHVRYVPEIWVKMRLGGTSNKSFKNIWSQNQDVLRALKEHKLPVNPFLFFACKLFSRGHQFFRRPAL
jgi:glycosyltransferase involved in cell wall biosynthesis